MIPIPPSPVPGPMWLGFAMDGSFVRQNGTATPYYRSAFIEAIPLMARYGFRSLAITTYHGTMRDAETVAGYWGPLREAAREHGITIIPGLYYPYAIPAVYGPQNVAFARTFGTNQAHQYEPHGCLDSRVTDEVVNSILPVCEFLGSPACYLDFEPLTNWSRLLPFWTDGNIRLIADQVSRAVAAIESAGVKCVAHALSENPDMPEYDRITAGIRAELSRRGCRPLVMVSQFNDVPPADTLSAAWPAVDPVGMASAQTNTGYRSFTPATWDAMVRTLSDRSRQVFFGRVHGALVEGVLRAGQNVTQLAALEPLSVAA